MFYIESIELHDIRYLLFCVLLYLVLHHSILVLDVTCLKSII